MNEFKYKIIRTPRRRTASVQVSPQNEVSIIVPDNLAQVKIDNIIRRKSSWIINKIKTNDAVRHPPKPKEYVSGEAFSYLGRNYRLKIARGNPQPVELKNGRFYVYVPDSVKKRDDLIRDALGEWYKSHAKNKLRSRISMYSERVGVSCRNIKVKNLKSRWGSCSKAGNININWRIIMAPLSIVDYVIVHELCHLKYHNHSKEFWRLLGQILPDYLKRKEWLRVNGTLLTF
ncbi:MAG: SprT family zinc-dependent metalloprotease [Candidatus Krumholzibacteriota bacterium]|nr:SprT family zinc-dependent metalloprotease [Candidatus Krumholzibacteriota bacterium]